MYLATLPSGVAAAIGATLHFAPRAAGAAVSSLPLSANITGLGACAPSHLVVLTDDKALSTVSVSAEGSLSVHDRVALPRRGSSLAVLPAPRGAQPPGSAGAPQRVVVVGDKTGDVYAFGVLPKVSQKRRHLLGHTASIVTAVALAPASAAAADGCALLLTADRDEKVRASRWDAPHEIEAYCLGHLRAVCALAPLPGDKQLLVSAGGDGALRLWHPASGALLHTLYYSAAGGAGAPPLGFTARACPPGVAHEDPDFAFSKSEGPDGEEEGGGGGGGGVEWAGDEGDSDGGAGGEGEGGGGDGGDSAAAADAPPAAPHTERTRIPSAARGLAPPPLPPQVVPAHLVVMVAASGGCDVSGVCVATFLVGEAALRLAAVRDGRLQPLGALLLRGGALPLHVVGGGDDDGALIVGVLAPRAGGAAPLWQYAVRRVRCGPRGGGDGAWVADAAATTGSPMLAEEGGEEGAGMIATLNAALAAAPLGEGGDPRAIAAAASPLTHLPVEFDKGTHLPQKPRKAKKGAAAPDSGGGGGGGGAAPAPAPAEG